MKWRALKWSMWPLFAIAVITPAIAHHSAAGYDLTQIYSAQATIKEFRWGAPHSSGVFVVKGKDGKVQELTIATATPGALIKQGFKIKDFKAGEKVEIEWHPARSGRPGGTLASMKLPDGRTFKDMEFAFISEATKQQLKEAESE